MIFNYFNDAASYAVRLKMANRANLPWDLNIVAWAMFIEEAKRERSSRNLKALRIGSSATYEVISLNTHKVV